MIRDALSTLQIVHRPKDPAGGGMAPDRLRRLQHAGLVIDTCQRQLGMAFGSAAPAACAANDRTAEVRSGVAGYTLLLQTITGLNSRVQGETNVQGQFKRQWQDWQSSAPLPQAALTRVLMEALLADSRAIRAAHLQGIGGQSYGSLVRRLLNPPEEARILLVGFGQLAESMLGLFSHWQTGLWTRHTLSSPPAAVTRQFAPSQATAAARWATHVILTTPPDAGHDAQWAARLGNGTATVTHLGRRRADRGPWHAAPGIARFSDLDDVFELQQRQSALRALQLLQARCACAQRAHARFFPSPTRVSMDRRAMHTAQSQTVAQRA